MNKLANTGSAELSGAGASILTQNWKTPMPLNVNDSDLYPEMTTFPKEQANGLTEMSFVLIRCEVGTFLQNSESWKKKDDGELFPDQLIFYL